VAAIVAAVVVELVSLVSGALPVDVGLRRLIYLVGCGVVLGGAAAVGWRRLTVPRPWAAAAAGVAAVVFVVGTLMLFSGGR
jgi:hypothetical protein